MTSGVALRRKGRFPWFSTAFIVVGAVVTVVPFADMVLGSFKSPQEFGRFPYTFWPQQFTFENYVIAFRQLDLARLFTNSLVVTATVTASVLLTSTAAGYALAKLRFKGRGAIFTFVLATMMFPPFLLLIPDFLIMANWPFAGGNNILGAGGHGLLGNRMALAIPFLVSGFGIFLVRQFMISIPDELLEAARIDGASELRIWWSIIVPQARPVALTLGVLTFVAQWNEYVWPLLISSVNPDLMTLPVGIQLLKGYLDPNASAPIVLAGLVVSFVPVLAVFLMLQKHYIRGVVTSGLK